MMATKSSTGRRPVPARSMAAQEASISAVIACSFDATCPSSIRTLALGFPGTAPTLPSPTSSSLRSGSGRSVEAALAVLRVLQQLAPYQTAGRQRNLTTKPFQTLRFLCLARATTWSKARLTSASCERSSYALA